MYAYKPYSINSLADLLDYEVFGEKARFMRQVGQCIWLLATNRRMEPYAYRPYTDGLFGEVYKNPFSDGKHEETGEEIIDNLLKGGG